MQNTQLHCNYTYHFLQCETWPIASSGTSRGHVDKFSGWDSDREFDLELRRFYSELRARLILSTKEKSGKKEWFRHDSLMSRNDHFHKFLIQITSINSSIIFSYYFKNCKRQKKKQNSTSGKEVFLVQKWKSEFRALALKHRTALPVATWKVL